jgi:hypothetical protein
MAVAILGMPIGLILGKKKEFLSNVVYGPKQRILLTSAPPLFSNF